MWNAFVAILSHFPLSLPQPRMFLLDPITDPLYLLLYHSVERCKALYIAVLLRGLWCNRRLLTIQAVRCIVFVIAVLPFLVKD